MCSCCGSVASCVQSIRATREYARSATVTARCSWKSSTRSAGSGDYGAARHLFTTQIAAHEAQDAMLLIARRLRTLVHVDTRSAANALAGAGDTVQLRAVADSMRDISTRSYYGRDRGLYHHVLGRIAMLGWTVQGRRTGVRGCALGCDSDGMRR